MKKLLTLLTLIALLSACGQKKSNTNETKQLDLNLDKEKVTVLYFHSNHRCATCMAVENTTKEALAEYYQDSVPFYSIDMTSDEAKDLIAEYKIAVQTLLIVKGDVHKNLTNNAFMYARSNPDKVKKEIKTTIDSL